MKSPELSGLRKLDYLPSIYLHIPFCGSKCGYCDFFSLAGSNRLEGTDPAARAGVIDSTLKQLKGMITAIAPKRVDTVYIGGGTPNSLNPDLFEFLLHSVGSLVRPLHFDEWTVELNPEHVTKEQLKLLASVGVTRVSAGIQSFSPRVLGILGRSASPGDNLRALDLIKEHWRGDLSLDLITAVAGQTLTDAQGDLESVLRYEPQHISLYSLSVEEGTDLFHRVEKGEITPLTDEHSAEILLSLWEHLEDMGYIHYEVSNFAQSGHESRHNLHYWRLDPYLGAGPGAISTLPLSKQKEPVRLETTRKLRDFSSHGEKNSPWYCSCEMETIGPGEFLLEYLMMGLRTSQGIQLSSFEEIFSCALEDLLPNTLRRKGDLLVLGEIPGRESCLRVTGRGMMLLDSLLLDIAGEIDGVEPELHWPPRRANGGEG